MILLNSEGKKFKNMTNYLTKPSVSIALATCNGEIFLREQLDSLIAQTFTDFEIIIADDASDDRTINILSEYAEKDSRIRVFKHQERLGLKQNFQFAMQHCCGQFIAPCDQDDIWLPQKLEQLVALIKRHNCSLVYCNSKLIGSAMAGQELTMFDKFRPVEGKDALQFAFKNCVSGHAALFDRSLLTQAIPFPENPMYDWWLAAIASSCDGIAFTREPLVLYRQHEDNVTDPFRSKKKTANRIWRFRSRKRQRVAAMEARLNQLRSCPGVAHEQFSHLYFLWTKTKLRCLNFELIRYLYKKRLSLWGENYKTFSKTSLKIIKLVL